MKISKLFSIQKTAEILGVSPHTVRMECYRGRLGTVRVCRRVLIHPDDLQEYLLTNRKAAK
jgi:excisionase family DNA binding protein